jgi:hypothetical protein
MGLRFAMTALRIADFHFDVRSSALLPMLASRLSGSAPSRGGNEEGLVGAKNKGLGGGFPPGPSLWAQFQR